MASSQGQSPVSGQQLLMQLDSLTSSMMDMNVSMEDEMEVIKSNNHIYLKYFSWLQDITEGNVNTRECTQSDKDTNKTHQHQQNEQQMMQQKQFGLQLQQYQLQQQHQQEQQQQLFQFSYKYNNKFLWELSTNRLNPINIFFLYNPMPIEANNKISNQISKL